MGEGKQIHEEVLRKIKSLDLEGGVKLFMKHLNEDPTLDSIYFVRHFLAPYLYCKKIDFNQLYENSYKAIHANPKRGDVWAFLGTIYKSQERYKEALDCYLKGFVFEPILPNLADIAFVYRNLGMFDESSKLLFCKGLFMRFFIGHGNIPLKYRIANQWQISLAVNNVNFNESNEEIIKGFKETGSKLLLLSFTFDEKDLNGNTGRRLIELFEMLQGSGIFFRVVHPLPVCIFGADYDKIFLKYHIPASCPNCVFSCVIKKDGCAELCNRFNKPMLKELPRDIKKRNVTKPLPAVCTNCAYFSRGICSGLCKPVKITKE